MDVCLGQSVRVAVAAGDRPRAFALARGGLPVIRAPPSHLAGLQGRIVLLHALVYFVVNLQSI